MSVVGIALLVLGFCLLAAYLGPMDRRQPLTLFLGLAFLLQGAADFIPAPYSRSLTGAALFCGLGFLAAYVSHVRGRMKEIAAERDERLRLIREAGRSIEPRPSGPTGSSGGDYWANDSGKDDSTG